LDAENQNKTPILGWITGLISLALIAVSIYVLQLFIEGYQCAKTIERVEFHLASRSSAEEISNDSYLQPVINKDNEKVWQLLRRLSFLESGNSLKLSATESKKDYFSKKQSDLNIDELIAKHDDLQNISNNLYSSLKNDLSQEFTSTYLLKSLQRLSLFVAIEKQNNDLFAKISKRSEAMSLTSRQDLLNSIRPIIPDRAARVYSSLRPMTQAILGDLPALEKSN